ncbi:MAG: hypothetical protein GY757_51345 [bacterium]|nr:hypothetical protein [bacterium]
MNPKKACVLYSGGADSTLAASAMLEKHQTVHLLSFKHNHMSQVEKTTQAADKLIAHFEKNTIVHHWIDMTAAWKALKKEPPNIAANGRGVFALLLKPCMACKAAMHLLTVTYCKENDLTVAADGAHPSGAALFPEQLQEGIDVLRNFYQNQNIAYENPVYTIDRPDFQLYEKGISEKKNTKDEHIYYSNQFACHVGLLAYVYHYLSRPFDKDKTKTIRLSIDYFKHCLSNPPTVEDTAGGPATRGGINSPRAKGRPLEPR